MICVAVLAFSSCCCDKNPLMEQLKAEGLLWLTVQWFVVHDSRKVKAAGA